MSDTRAVVVGLCAHGLAISRSLRDSGVSVLALEKDETLPGVKTNSAEVRIIEDINGPGLIEDLVSLAPSLSVAGTPVLFLTNDTMIKTVGTDIDKIKSLYRISWLRTAGEITSLLRKERVGERSQESGISYPRTKLVSGKGDMAVENIGLNFPVIFKPDTPISSYKTYIAESPSELDSAWKTVQHSLPTIAQEYIPGDDSCIYFAALYLEKGDVVARFEGRKLRSRPLGHTTVAISESNDETHVLAKRFFEGLSLSGPVSLEMKKDPDSQFWVIEPTVGRSDFWVGLCINDGINLPMIEYLVETGQRIETRDQRNGILWINGERDPAALIWLLFKFPSYLIRMRIVGVYLQLRDIRPWLRWQRTFLQRIPIRLANKCAKLLRATPQ